MKMDDGVMIHENWQNLVTKTEFQCSSRFWAHWSKSDCGDDRCVCFGAPIFEIGRKCFCMLEIPKTINVPAGFGVVGQNLHRLHFLILGSVALLIEFDCGDDRCVCFGVPSFEKSRNCIWFPGFLLKVVQTHERIQLSLTTPSKHKK
jgi:hypothetical protein